MQKHVGREGGIISRGGLVGQRSIVHYALGLLAHSTKLLEGGCAAIQSSTEAVFGDPNESLIDTSLPGCQRGDAVPTDISIPSEAGEARIAEVLEQ